MKVLVAAAHADDEVLGCGGVIARLIDEGNDVRVVFFTNGVGARKGQLPVDVIDRRSAAEQAIGILGAKLLSSFSFSDNAMDGTPIIEIIREFEDVLRGFEPEVLFTHHAGDLNVDHRLVHEVVMTACRPQPDSGVREIYSFEVASSTGWSSPSMGNSFQPQRFIDISTTWDRKQKALEAYSQEMRAYPHARSIEAMEALVKYRGSQVGMVMAEAFVVERQVIKELL
jgi:N-acetylglucosamine malate deacetylase 1